jgi:hypothetical protein
MALYVRISTNGGFRPAASSLNFKLAHYRRFARRRAMPRKTLSTGPTGLNRISLDGQHMVRWQQELSRSGDELWDVVATAGASVADVQRHLEGRRSR